MGEILELLAPWAVTTALLFALLAWDERRLPDDALARAWPPATKRIAVVVGGALCLPIHFTRTRRSIWGFLLGVAYMVGVSVAGALVTVAVDWAFGIAD